jgi:aspartate dehydrogenase
MNVGLLGCGAIGSSLAQAILSGQAGTTQLVAICDVYQESVDALYSHLCNPDLFVTTDPRELLRLDTIDLVVEAASQETVRLIAESVLAAGKHLMIMSIGALRDDALTTRIEELARKNGLKVYLPSGAICGLDGVKAASIEKISHIEITTTKHPKGLEGAPYLKKHSISLSGLSEPTTIFQGMAKDAAQGFPKNVNVAVALSLAGAGVANTKVTIIADPKATRTQHEIKVQGDFGELYTKVRNFVHPNNPKTSYLAALAAIRTLRKIMEPIQIGT